MPNRPTRDATPHREAAKTLGALLRQERLRLGYSQQRLAAMAGVAIGTVRGLEGQRSVDPSFFTVLALADALGLDTEVLVRRVGPQSSTDS